MLFTRVFLIKKQKLSFESSFPLLVKLILCPINRNLPGLCQQIGWGPFQHDYAPVHKGRSIKAWLNEPGVEELDWLAQSPDLNPIKHLWDELELLQAKHFPSSSCLISQMIWINGLRFPQIHSKILRKTSPEEWKLLKLQRWDGLHINAYGFRMERHQSSYWCQCVGGQKLLPLSLAKQMQVQQIYSL